MVLAVPCNSRKNGEGCLSRSPAARLAFPSLAGCCSKRCGSCLVWSFCFIQVAAKRATTL